MSDTSKVTLFARARGEDKMSAIKREKAPQHLIKELNVFLDFISASSFFRFKKESIVQIYAFFLRKKEMMPKGAIIRKFQAPTSEDPAIMAHPLEPEGVPEF
jgi:hypothetical protein